MRRLIQLCGILAMLAGTALMIQGSYIQAKAALAQLLLERAWHQSLEHNRPVRPWPWADSHPIAQLEIPAIGLKQIVLSGASGRNLAFAPTHLRSSAAPNSGGTTVLSAHRDTHFSGLEAINKGDLIILHSAQQSQHYRITDINVADSRHQQLALDSGDRLLLVTCYPFASLTTGGPLRYVVSAEPVASQFTTQVTTHPMTAQRSDTSDWVF